MRSSAWGFSVNGVPEILCNLSLDHPFAGTSLTIARALVTDPEEMRIKVVSLFRLRQRKAPALQIGPILPRNFFGA